MPLVENELNKLFGKQFLIVGFINAKLEVVNKIKNGYDSNVRVYYDRFLLFTAHIFYRSIVIDLCALYNRSENYNFHKLYQNREVSQCLSPKDCARIKSMIKSHSSEIQNIINLRNKEYAHYDDLENGISLTLDNMAIVNDLFDTAKLILELCGQNLNTSIDLQMDNYAESLEALLKK